MRSAFQNFLSFIGGIVVFFIVLGVLAIALGVRKIGQNEDVKVAKDSVLFLELKGVIIDGKKFLRDLRKYREDESIKAILVRIESPGGVVGPSQEIYQELKISKEKFKKPVVVHVPSLAASGGYYGAVAADRIVVAPGAMLGSIGVIMELANLEDLYAWAKIKRSSIKTGKFKDIGADYRKMTDEENQFLQNLVDGVLEQFIQTVAEGRGKKVEEVRPWADGRIFTGETAVKFGFADEIGTLTDAKRIVGELSGLGENVELFSPPKSVPNPFDYLMYSPEEEETEARLAVAKSMDDLLGIKQITRQFLRPELVGQPLYLMPGTGMSTEAQ